MDWVNSRLITRNNSLLQGQSAISPVIPEAGSASLGSTLGGGALVVGLAVEEIGKAVGGGGARIDKVGLVGGQGEVDVAPAVLVSGGGEDVVGVEVKVGDGPGDFRGGLGGLDGGASGGSRDGGGEGQGGSGAGEVDHFDGLCEGLGWLVGWW